MSGYVYFIGPEALFFRDEETRLVKIGYTRVGVQSRLSALQCGSPLPLELFAYTDGGKRLEQAFHDAFAECRSHGEWFFLSGRLADFLGYFDRPPGDKYVSPEQVEVALYDNLLHDDPPYPIADAEAWRRSGDIRPLLTFYPDLAA